MDPVTQRLDDEILSLIRRYGMRRQVPDALFNALALKIFRYQYERNTFYRRWCRAEGVEPQRVRSWKHIPAVPARAFKAAWVACFPRGRQRRVFRTSGTSRSGRGRHPMDTLALYDAAIVAPFRRACLRDGAKLRWFFLMPSSRECPDSSLSYMMDVVNRTFARGRGRYFVRGGRPDHEALWRALSREKGKVFLLATAFALKSFLDDLSARGRSIRLAAGSRIFETGGFKGRVKEVSKRELYRMCGRILGVSSRRIVSEYGMTELTSQYYDGVAPPWMRPVVVDPSSGREAPAGACGLLRHVDLANRGSVAAVETEDWGRLRGGRLELLGRAPGAALRGCSLAFEKFLAA